jgi:hypothetical protein
MDKYDLLQTLEMVFPNSSDKEKNDSWFIANQNEDQKTVTITFFLHEKETQS